MRGKKQQKKKAATKPSTLGDISRNVLFSTSEVLLNTEKYKIIARKCDMVSRVCLHSVKK